MSSVFKDANSKEWLVQITVGALKRVKAFTSFELDNLVVMPSQKKKSRAEMEAEAAAAVQPLRDFLANLVRFSEALYAIVQPACEAAGVTHEQFDDALRGESIEDARIAFLESLTDFFPQAPRKLIARGLLEETKQMKVLSARGMIQAEKMIAAKKADLETTIAANLEEAFSKSAIESPEKPEESTPIPIRSAS